MLFSTTIFKSVRNRSENFAFFSTTTFKNVRNPGKYLTVPMLVRRFHLTENAKYLLFQKRQKYRKMLNPPRLARRFQLLGSAKNAY